MQNLDLCERCLEVNWTNLPNWKNWINLPECKNWTNLRGWKDWAEWTEWKHSCNPDDSIYSTQKPPKTRIVRAFRNKSGTELRKSTCPICYLVGHLVNPSFSSRADPGSQDPGDQLLNVCLEARDSGRECSNMFATVNLAVRSPATGSTKITGDDKHDYIRSIIAGKSTNDMNARVRELEPSKVSFDFLKKKVTKCLNNHRECRSTEAEVGGLRVINVDTEEIDDAPKDCAYIALSYVWGPKSSCQCTQERFRPVVQDAITVTKRLGWKYLWVDQYCIDQRENSSHKESMFQQMNRIYSNARATIIAASGDSACVKLPGVVGKPSCKSPAVQPRHQNIITIGETRLIEMSNGGSDTIKSSVWATRGWTYQEGYLSKRRLIFTENEVLFLCNKEFGSETLRYHHKTDPFLWMIPSTMRSENWANCYLQPHIWLHIKEYSKRNLSDGCDSLNAFLGILKDYESNVIDEDGPTFHLSGIPLKLFKGFKEVEIFFSLFWKHQYVARRVDNLPSWSWSGWRGPVQGFGWKTIHLRLQPLPVKDNGLNRGKNEATERLFQIRIPHGDKTIDLHSFIRERQSGTLSHDVDPKEIWITSFIVPLRLRQVNTYPPIKDAQNDSQQPSRVVATFSLNPDVFFGFPIFFDGDYTPEFYGWGLVIPCNGRFYEDQENYMIIVLHSIGDGKYERAGIGGFFYWADSLWPSQSVRGFLGDDRVVFLDKDDHVMDYEEAMDSRRKLPTKYFFLKNSKWETIRLV